MKNEDKETRYFIDIDLDSRKILNWDFDQREDLIVQEFSNPSYHRVFITKGQFNKLVKKDLDLKYPEGAGLGLSSKKDNTT